ncbi:glycosyltransferase family 4 protein [Devosia lucknowensis]|uniref:glycosyltransferase family 4 protein n=1 Tax=Devosia lucknowensis TaxID=1096929 RepID=UPI001FCDCAEC
MAELVNRGHELTVLTGKPNYPRGEIFPEFLAAPQAYNSFEGAEVVRVGLLPRGRGGLRLMLNYLSFMISASVVGSWKLRGRKVEAIFVFEPSPITIGIPAIVLKWLKRAPIAFWVLDLWPQSLEAVGAVRSRAVLRLVDHLVRFIYRHCDAVLAQSRSFMTAIGEQIDDPKRIIYFPSWAEPAPTIDSVIPAPEIEARPDLFDIVFTGNVGEAQDFAAVLMAAQALRNEPVRWIIVGDGRKSAWLAEEVQRLNLQDQVLLPGRFGLDRMPSFFRHADALLVSLRNEPIFALTIPGKLQSYLGAGIPILAMLNGEGAEIVTTSGAGMAVAAGDGAGLAEAVLKMRMLDPEQRAKMGERGLACIAKQFDRDKLIAQLEGILFTLEQGVKTRRDFEGVNG